MCLADCVPGLTPHAVLSLPWVYAMGLIEAKADAMDLDVGDASGIPAAPRGEPVRSGAGFDHAPGFSALLRMVS